MERTAYCVVTAVRRILFDYQIILSSNELPHTPMHAMVLRCMLSVALALVGGARAGAESAYSPAPVFSGLKSCVVPGIAGAQCAILNVPESRDGASRRTLPLRILLLPAETRKQGSIPIFVVAGGPGGTITEAAAAFGKSWERQEHDVVLVDQRGTGAGHRLDCFDPVDQRPFATPFTYEFTKRCRESLSKHFDLSQFSTPNSVADLEDVRQALGYNQIGLEAVSFGTYLSVMYMREHPDRVGAALLFSLVSPDNPVPLYFARSTQSSFDGLVAECEADPQCGAAFPALHDDFNAVLRRLKSAPATVAVKKPDGSVSSVSLNADDFADAVRVMLYVEARSRELPLLIHQARNGNYEPFVRIALDADTAFYHAARLGLFFSITCNEFISRIRPEDIAPATAGTFAGDHRVLGQIDSCSKWPKTHLPERMFSPFVVNVPTVLISGRLDPVTPPSWSEAARKFLPNSLRLIVPGGHGPWSPCTSAIGAQLFATRS